MRHLAKTLALGISVLFLFALFSCVSVPPEAPELSAELGKRINAIQDSHLALMHMFFKEKRERMDEFIMNEWVPEFAGSLFEKETVRNMWEKSCRSDDPAFKTKFLTFVGPRIQKKINETRLEYMKPLEELERELERALRKEYNQAKALNNSITSYLASASDVAESRNRYLEMFGVTEEKLRGYLSKADEAVQNFTTSTKNTLEKGREYKAKMQNMIEKLRTE